MEGCERQDLEVALSTHCAKFRAPKFLLNDHGPSSDIITSQDSILELLRDNVSIEILPASHQFFNTIESTIRVFKGINRTIGFGVPSEEPLKTRAEISMIYSHIANILNSRPLVAGQSDRELVVNSNQLCKPFLSNADQELILSKFLQEIFTEDEQSGLISKIFSNNSLMAKGACYPLRQEFLNSNSKLFTNKSEGLRPKYCS